MTPTYARLLGFPKLPKDIPETSGFVFEALLVDERVVTCVVQSTWNEDSMRLDYVVNGADRSLIRGWRHKV